MSTPPSFHPDRTPRIQPPVELCVLRGRRAKLRTKTVASTIPHARLLFFFSRGGTGGRRNYVDFFARFHFSESSPRMPGEGPPIIPWLSQELSPQFAGSGGSKNLQGKLSEASSRKPGGGLLRIFRGTHQRLLPRSWAGDC